MRPRRLSRAAQKELRDDARLLRAWRHYHREQLEQALAGPHGASVAEIMNFLQHKMTLQSAPELLALIRQHAHQVDATVRLVLLHEINCASVRLRERNNLPPFNDALPGGRPTLFELARTLLDPEQVAAEQNSSHPKSDGGNGAGIARQNRGDGHEQ